VTKTLDELNSDVLCLMANAEHVQVKRHFRMFAVKKNIFLLLLRLHICTMYIICRTFFLPIFCIFKSEYPR
jgi:hypothetical protein